MNTSFHEPETIDPELFKLLGGLEAVETTRREFFGIAGTGLIIALLLGEEANAQPGPGRRGPGGFGRGGPREIGAWLHVGADSAITVYTGKVEIGQNIRTSLAQVVAEELHAPFKSIRLVMADTAAVPFDMGTFGSMTTPRMAPQLRRAAAAAREALLDLAVEKSKVARASLTVVSARIKGPDGKPSFTFGQLTKGKKLMKAIPADVSTTAADRWKVAGTSAPKVDGRAFVTGSHPFASDIRRPGMLFGKVLRAPALRAKLVTVNTKAVEKKRDLTVVKDGDFVAVVGPTEFAAAAGMDLIKAEWQTTPQVSAKELFRHLKEKAGRGGGGGRFGRFGGANAQGSMELGLKAASKTVKATYTIAYIAHVPLETRTAVAEWHDGKVTVWTGTQRPFGVRDEVARALDVPTKDVRVIVPDMGSGYGGKHSGQAAVEAARMAKAVGKPVKIVWTREEEYKWAYFRPAGVIEVTAGAKKDGTLTAWEHHNYNSGPSAIRTPYTVPNTKTEYHSTDSPLPQGAYRALAATANTFARESVMDELAHELGMDALAFRLKNLKEPRLRAVLEAAARRFGWNKKKPAAGGGFGLACGTEKGSYVATCAEVAIDRAKKQVHVVRAVTAFECGAILNPDHLKNQVEGALMMGLGGALFEHIDFKDGVILNPSFSDYKLPRFRDTPRLETVLLDRKDLPSAGAGETPIIGIAPAVGNAIFAATGIRLRSLPMVPNGLEVKEKK